MMKGTVRRPVPAALDDKAAPHCVIGRDIANDFESASRREWLVTNGIGGFAAGTVAGANTRRYHGVLIASFKPPVERTVLVSKVNIAVHYLNARHELSADEFEGGTIAPTGFTRIESFRIEDGIPVWRFAVADALLEQRLFMAPGRNVSYVGLRVIRASAPLKVEFQPLCTYRDYHSHSRGVRPFVLEAGTGDCSIRAFDGARPIRLSLGEGSFEAAPDWYWNFFHRAEGERGLDTGEDLYTPGRFKAQLTATQEIFFIASAESAAPASGTAALAELTRASAALRAALPGKAPTWVQQLALASDQFLVTRGGAQTSGSSVIAGYPWFADWGRDTMIALPGLTSSLGRHAIAADVLRTFARFVDRGMLPNRFPDGGEPPEYNTADATLWFFQAIREAALASGDRALGRDLYPTLIGIIRAHVAGTRYGISVDPKDALLRAGEPGVQLTWMDAKVGDWVVTPRTGKQVEINALWLNALAIAQDLAQQCRDPAGKQLCGELLSRGTASFARFWNASAGYLYDVIDVDGGTATDASLRPNQLFAVSLPYSALNDEQMRAVVDVCAHELLTSYGLRSLARRDSAYVGRYGGHQLSRDGAYHQGTVWSWLLGPFALAHFKAYQDAALAQSFLEPISHHLRDACLGSISEIFDGDAPHASNGCFAQAWSVAEVLRTWLYLQNAAKKREA
jgi:predicted glycogen debranching enzyme